MTTKAVKTFDCVKLQRKIRAELSRRWGKMSRQEIFADLAETKRRWLEALEAKKQER